VARRQSKKNADFEIFPWNDNFGTGIQLIDEQHQQLVAILNKLARHFVSGTTETASLEQIIAELADYADYHFRSEEEIWHKHFTGHPMLEAHERAHHDFFEKIKDIQTNRGSLEDFADELFGFLTRWLAFHILDSDKRMALATLGVDQGQSLPQALKSADDEMTGSLAVLIKAVLDMYGELSASTIELMRQKIARQRAEEKLRETTERLNQQQLHLSEERYRVLFDAIPDAVVVAAADTGLILDANTVMESTSGFERSQLLSMTVIELHPLQSQTAHRAQLAEMAQQNHVRAKFESEILRADGNILDVEVSVQGPFSRGDEKCLVGIFRDISESKRHQQALERAAYFDESTGLLNRNGIKRYLDSVVASDSDLRSALIIHVDLDNFTLINERYGSESGDQILRQFARQLESHVPDCSKISRLGGDEFLLVLHCIPERAMLAAYMADLIKAIQQPLVLDDTDIPITVSAGVKYSEDLSATSAEVLIRQTSHALYLAKIRGKSQFHILDQDHEDAERSKHSLLKAISQGLRLDQFELFYQPKVHMPSGRVVGAEALIRWRHPKRGLLTPAAFLPVTENHPVSIEIDQWVVAQAIRQLSQWRATQTGITISVNISPLSLQNPDFASQLITRLPVTPDFDTQCLQIEVLESSAMENIDKAIVNLRKLKDAGLSTAIDDFGTGYSSLSYLKRLPIDWLKLDQSFVMDMANHQHDLDVIRGIVGICDAFGMTMIAEGVETIEQGSMLLTLGCEYAQGYVIAKPMPARDFPEWLQDWKAPEAWTAQNTNA
jgi:hemerythrin-like metal-binding protein/diguanylate cyclase (GGDEF)-like protein/PAS domain S-box-containing protein